MMRKTTLFMCAMALAVCAGAAAAAGLDLTAALSPDAAAFGLSLPASGVTALFPPDAALGLAAFGAAGMTKLTVRSPVQHDGVTYSEGRHDVEDEDVANSLISSGAATEGWTEKEGALSEAGTQTPPPRSAPTGRVSAPEDGRTPRRAGGEEPDKTTRGSSKT